MQVLVVEDERVSRLQTTKLAESLGHTVQAVETAEEAINVLSRGGIELLFTDLILPKRSGIELTQWVRSREKDAHLFILLLTSKDAAATMEEAFAAGIDDFVRKGASVTEIAARFRVAERISRVERHMRERAHELDTALRRLEISAAMRGTTAAKIVAKPEPTKPELLSNLRTWKMHESVLKTVLAENVKHELASHDTPVAEWSETALAAKISLTDVEHKVEMEIVLMAERPAVHTIACAIFGDPEMVDEALVADTMLELANGTMGAFKTAFHTEDYRFTPSIPKPVHPGALDVVLAHSTDRRQYTFKANDVVVTAFIGVRLKTNRKLKASALREGMVLAEPVMRAGAMLLKAGTRLSVTLIERLHLIDKEMIVELSDPSE